MKIKFVANFIIRVIKQISSQFGIKSNSQESFINKFNTMAKKIASKKQSKKLRRTSTMEKVVAQGEMFLAESKKKRPTRTRTMAEAIKEGQQMLSRGTKRITRSVVSKGKAVKPEAQIKGKKQKKIKKPKITKKTSSGEGKKGKPAKADKTVKRDSTKKSEPTKPVVPPASKPVNLKKTVFKTKSKDHLPIPAFGFIDVCFCIDATGSMGSQLAQAQSTILSIIGNIEKKVQTEGLTLRFAIVSYRDHPPQDSTYVTQILDFTDGHSAGEYVNKLQAWGGGDEPEAVHDGLMDSCKKLNWVQLPGTPILRYIFHIADARPHGKQFGSNHQKFGCLCGMQTSQVFHEINKRQIHYRLIKVRTNPGLNIMEDQFKNGIMDFQSTDLSHARQMDVKVSDMIIQEVIPDGV